jgi:hypothetical protein
VTTEVLDALGAQIDRLIASSTVRDLRDERKSATQELSTALLELMTFLRDVLDPAMRSFQRREPRFYEEYRNSRRIGGRKPKESDDEATETAEAEADADADAKVKSKVDQETKGEVTAPVAAAPATMVASESKEAEATGKQMKAEGWVVDQDAEVDAELEKVIGENGGSGATGERGPVEGGATPAQATLSA